MRSRRSTADLIAAKQLLEEPGDPDRR